MAKYVWDEIGNRPLKIKNGIVYDEVAGEEFSYNERKHLENFIPIMESSYELFATNLILYHATGNQTCIIEINQELRKYGL
ncbi:hypothetical protein [Neobacillus niacini]|uniref:hypothetical protein n=1 Tax=Neobacillus niacini TaxID=86668 RepID=UPI0005EFCE92|nr:hypothetical protein [Neobacillus niacini]